MQPARGSGYARAVAQQRNQPLLGTSLIETGRKPFGAEEFSNNTVDISEALLPLSLEQSCLEGVQNRVAEW